MQMPLLLIPSGWRGFVVDLVIRRMIFNLVVIFFFILFFFWWLFCLLKYLKFFFYYYYSWYYWMARKWNEFLPRDLVPGFNIAISADEWEIRPPIHALHNKYSTNHHQLITPLFNHWIQKRIDSLWHTQNN